MEHSWNDTDMGKPKYLQKTLLITTLSTTNLTWTDPGLKQDLRHESPVNNHLISGKAISLNDISKFCSYLTDKTHTLCYKALSSGVVQKNI